VLQSAGFYLIEAPSSTCAISPALLASHWTYFGLQYALYNGDPTIVEALETRDSGRLSEGMIIDDRAAGENGEAIDSRRSMKGGWTASVTIRVTDERILETGVRSFPGPISEERDGDCMGSSALRLFNRILRNWNQVATTSVRIPPTVPPMIAAVGIRFTARDDFSDNEGNAVDSLEDSEEELEDVVDVNGVGVPAG